MHGDRCTVRSLGRDAGRVLRPEHRGRCEHRCDHGLDLRLARQDATAFGAPRDRRIAAKRDRQSVEARVARPASRGGELMPGLKAIIDALEPTAGGWRGAIPDSWLQGRTSYGGLSAALAFHAAQQSDADLPPLRSALIAFIGPLSGDIVIRASRLRRGRNAAFVQADVESEAGLGLRAPFVFMRAVDPMVERSAAADCLPPAALKLVGGPAPCSSMTWQLNVLGAQPRTTDGWWLLRTDTDFARHGSSSQEMMIWNADGEPVAEQMQSVAIFA